ncbi:MAG: response regulator [Methylococcales bacterium]|nr:response regulator [Methylococcales bacterium]
MNDNDDLNYIKTLSILYVEDDDNIREQLRQFLARRSTTLYLAKNGEEGLKIFEKHRPDMVITDILMPIMDGLKMGEVIRTLCPKVPIIITTAFEEPRFFHRAIDLGVSQYVSKPVDLDILETALLECAHSIRADIALSEIQERTAELLLSQHIAKLSNWKLDFASEKIAWSEEFLHILEVNAANFGDNYSDFLAVVHPEDRERVQQIYYAHLQSDDAYDIEHRLLLADGRIKYVHERCQTERDNDGKPLQTLCVVQDITARKLFEVEMEQYHQHLEDLVVVRTSELEKAKNEAEAMNHAKSVFLANMNHELRTPLNAILGFAQLMDRDPLLCKTHRDELKIINRAGQHLLALINDVLEISRIEAGHTAIENSPFDLEDVLLATEEMIRTRAEAKGLNFKVERLGVLPHFVQGDAHHLRQVLLNLLGNAVKYTRHGSVTFRITPMNRGIHFEIMDTGLGITTVDAENIFHPFYQVETNRVKSEGSGLGLTISQNFVRLMGGEIIVSSAPNVGSTFEFTIQLPSVKSPVILSKILGHVIKLSAGQPHYRVMVAEDNPDNRLLLTLLLEDVGFDVCGVENGQQAVKVFQVWHPDFIWMDMEMPVMNGYEATPLIRASLPHGQIVKIVALTASVFKEERDAILATGCDDMLAKPFNEDQLFEIMRQQLSLKFDYATEVKGVALATENLLETVNFKLLSDDIRADLYHAAELLDVEAVLELVAKIKTHYPDHANVIEAWVAEFHFEKIQAAANINAEFE